MTDKTNEPGGRAPAPGDLRLVQLFVNSRDVEGGTEEFSSPQALASWLSKHGLTSRPLRLATSDLRRALEYREALRAMALANNGVLLDEEGIARANRVLSRMPMVARVHRPDEMTLEAVGKGIDHALGQIVGIVVTEALAGRWHRLKACARDACHWAFYDHSKSQTGRWCTMSICGSRTKMKAYYRRRQGTARKRPIKGA